MERRKGERLSFALKARWCPPAPQVSRQTSAGRVPAPPQAGPPGHGLLPVLVLRNTDPRRGALDWSRHSQAAARGAWLCRASGVAPGPRWGSSQYPLQEKGPPGPRWGGSQYPVQEKGPAHRDNKASLLGLGG